MKLSRSSRVLTVLIALFGVLFMQLAVAGYACPDQQSEQADGHMTMPLGSMAQDMSDCKGIDVDQPGLCDAHAKTGKQSLDKPELPQVPSFVAAGKAVTLQPISASYRPPATQSQRLLLTRTTAPPLAIRNCCFRI